MSPRLDEANVPRGRGYWIALIAILALHLALCLRFWWVTDDAYISFRFARNLALGHGPRFNVWDAPPVEGYSNFLWVVLGAGVHVLGLDMVVWMPVLSWLCGAALLALLLARLTRGLGVGLPIAGVAVAGLACYPPFAVWSTSGLATLPFALLLFATLDRLALAPGGPRWLSGGLCACGVALIRVEGIAWVGLVLVLALLAQLLERRLEVAPLLRAGALALAVTALHVLWRESYYGEWLPNTVHAKHVEGEGFVRRGYQYVAASWLTFLVPFLILPGALFALRPRRIGRGMALAALAFAFPVYAVVVSGDYMAMGRFLVPGFAFATVLVAWMLQDMAGQSALRTGFALALGVAIAVVGLLPGFDRHLLPEETRSWCNYRFERAEKHDSEYQRWLALDKKVRLWRERGRQMRAYADAALEPPVSMVAQTLGALGWETDFLMYDCAGLIVPEIARVEVTHWENQPGHDKAVEPEYFIDEGPSLLRYVALDDESRVAMRVSQQVGRWRSPKIREGYRPELVEMVPEEGESTLLLLLVHSDVPAPQAWRALERSRTKVAVEPRAVPY